MRYIIFLLLICIASCKSPDKKKAAADWMLRPFVKVDSANPVLLASSAPSFIDPIWNRPVKWMEKDVFNPAAVVRNDTLYLLFRAEDNIGKYNGTSRVGLAWSLDGLHFNIKKSPVFYPNNDAYKGWEWEGGAEDPRVTQSEDGTYYMTYTAYDGNKARLFVASSPDLQQWTKWGRAFEDSANNKYADGWSKSGSIVSDYSSGTPVAKKIRGKYWMYWGDQNIWAATSDDLVHWKPVLYGAADARDTTLLRGVAKEMPELKPVFGPRPKKFDSDLVEPGPPAMLTNEGILLFYNSRNVPATGDSSLAEGTYAAGQILLDKKDPTKVLRRSDHFFMAPEKPYEIEGQVGRVTFVEGLVRYKGKWFLYYGTADSKIAVAVCTDGFK